MGTSGWSYPGWTGHLYPPGTSAARMLAVYAARFPTVEAHGTHRRRPTPASLARWTASVPPTFRFAPKAHAGLTHRRDLTGVDDRMRDFTEALAPLGPLLGPVLFVLPHRRPDLDRLRRLLDALPPEGPAAVFELAPAWHVPEVLDMLERSGASLALVDRAGDPPPTSPPPGRVAYVRLRAPSYSDDRLDAWASRALDWAGAGRETYLFVRHDETGEAPRYAGRLVEHLRTR